MSPWIAHLLPVPLRAGVLSCGDPPNRSPRSISPVTDELLRASPDPKEGWPSHGYAWDNQRYVPLTPLALSRGRPPDGCGSRTTRLRTVSAPTIPLRTLTGVAALRACLDTLTWVVQELRSAPPR